MATTSCWFLVFVLVVWWLPLMLAGPEDQQVENCPAKTCGNLIISHPFWILNMETTRSCGSLDFEVVCLNDSIPLLRSSVLFGFAIRDISYEEHSLHAVDLHKETYFKKEEEDFNVSKSCHFPRWNTSVKLAPPFKVTPANVNLIFYNCTKTVALVEVRCPNASNMFVRAGVPHDATGNYAGYALEGCNATVVPVMGSSSGSANASDYEQLIEDDFLLTWDLPSPVHILSFFNHGILSYTYLHRPTAKSSVLMATSSCWLLVFVWVIWRLPLMLAEPEVRQGKGCSAKRCGHLNISHPFWLPDMEAGRSCGPLDFVVNCNNSVPVLKSSGLTGFAILNISYEKRNLRVIDVYKEEDFKDSKSCHFPGWNTSGKLALPFKVSPANLNLIFYNCTKPPTDEGRALGEMRCGNASNTFVRAGVRFDVTGNYGGYVLEGCNATVVPVMDSSGKAKASDYERLISGGYIMTWDHPEPLPAPLPVPTPSPARKFTRRLIF
ncbi:hypothetical protein CFC21_112321 [Triticum aestivum]|uniref:Wall-associated receptor kinase galacturonan-binding domain-containing protein n=2 Tax=Triticum aestivum TaxID=4565 RepID=A0A9R0G4L5_WHEAT|nr:hypothetical protein [Triticum aestivum]CDM80933.1 unnamed protein product [Triticum aestivum]